jgi:hypothetical protein
MQKRSVEPVPGTGHRPRADPGTHSRRLARLRRATEAGPGATRTEETRTLVAATRPDRRRRAAATVCSLEQSHFRGRHVVNPFKC